MEEIILHHCVLHYIEMVTTEVSQFIYMRFFSGYPIVYSVRVFCLQLYVCSIRVIHVSVILRLCTLPPLPNKFRYRAVLVVWSQIVA